MINVRWGDKNLFDGFPRRKTTHTTICEHDKLL